MTNKLSKKIFWLNFLLSLMIVSYHANNVSIYFDILQINIIGKWWSCFENFISCVEQIAVPTFFLMSGFLFFINYEPNKAKDKLKSRIRTLLIPYLLWNIISWLFYLCLTHLPYISDNVNMTMDLSFRGIIYEILMGKYNALWFVRVLIILDILSPCLYYAIKGKMKSILFIIILICLEVIFNRDAVSVLYSSIFFCVGAILALNFIDIFSFNFRKSKWLLISFLLICLCTSQYITNFSPRILCIYLLFLLILFWYGVDCFIKYLPERKNAPWFANNSFFLYCSHGIILESVEKIILLIGGITISGAIIDYIFSPIITVVIVICIEYVMIKYFKYIWNILNGGRGSK